MGGLAFLLLVAMAAGPKSDDLRGQPLDLLLHLADETVEVWNGRRR